MLLCTCRPGFLQRLVRINKNRANYEPTHKEILKGYMRKYRKMPTLGEDVSDAESEGDEGEEGDSEGGGCESD